MAHGTWRSSALSTPTQIQLRQLSIAISDQRTRHKQAHTGACRYVVCDPGVHVKHKEVRVRPTAGYRSRSHRSHCHYSSCRSRSQQPTALQVSGAATAVPMQLLLLQPRLRPACSYGHCYCHLMLHCTVNTEHRPLAELARS